MSILEVTAKTGVIQSSLYKNRTKACSQGWAPHKVLETWHVDDTPYHKRPLIPTALVKFIVETMTKNSTTKRWSCERIAAEVSNTPGVTELILGHGRLGEESNYDYSKLKRKGKERKQC
jgi:hypothetical protein